MRAALYFRVSTDEQKERASIETQREFAAQYCKVHEITVIASYSDDGVSVRFQSLIGLMVLNY